MASFVIKTEGHRQVIDLGEKLEELLKGAPIKTGLLHLLVRHTTACLTTADLDPGTDRDLLEALEAMVPKLEYRHPHDPSPSHVGEHIMSSIVGPTVLLPFDDGALRLGTWQRPVLVELSGPRERTIEYSFLPIA